MKQINFILFFVLMSIVSFAQTHFSKDYSDETNGINLTTLAVNIDGSYYASGTTLIGSTTQFPLLVKFDINGEIIWQKYFDQLPSARIYDIKINKEGACLLVFKHLSGFGTMKVDPLGNVLWAKSYSDPTNSSFSHSPYTKYSLSITKDQQLFVNISQFTFAGSLYKISDDDGPGDGDGDGDDDEDDDGDDDDDGGDIDTIIVIDDSTSAGKIPPMCMTLCDDDTSVIVVGKDNDDCYAYRVGMSGTVLWTKVYQDYTSNYIRMKSIIPLKDGNYIMAGLYSTVYGSQYDKGIVSKMNKNGDILWSKIYSINDGSLLDFEKIIQTNDERLYIIGSKVGTGNYLSVYLEISTTGTLLKSGLLNNRDLYGVTFPTASIDASINNNNIMMLTSHMNSALTLSLSCINKSSSIDNISCSTNNIDITVTDFMMASLPTRPVTAISSGTSTIVTDVIGKSTVNMDLTITTNCKTGECEVVNSIHEYASDNTLLTYPNPVLDVLNFELNNINNAIIKVYDIKGNIIINELLSKSSINVSNLSSGQYIYLIVSDENTFKGKFIK